MCCGCESCCVVRVGVLRLSVCYGLCRVVCVCVYVECGWLCGGVWMELLFGLWVGVDW